MVGGRAPLTGAAASGRLPADRSARDFRPGPATFAVPFLVCFGMSATRLGAAGRAPSASGRGAPHATPGGVILRIVQWLSVSKERRGVSAVTRRFPRCPCGGLRPWRGARPVVRQRVGMIRPRPAECKGKFQKISFSLLFFGILIFTSMQNVPMRPWEGRPARIGGGPGSAGGGRRGRGGRRRRVGGRAGR